MNRFTEQNQTVTDGFTGLMWLKNASVFPWPMTWSEALAYIKEMNMSGRTDYNDWRLPNRRELFSLVSHDRINPSLPADHPFENVFSGYYWTSTTCSRLPQQAWYIHIGGARVFKGMKHGFYMVWPVRTTQHHEAFILKTGQQVCYNEKGLLIDCFQTGQDGEFRSGIPWAIPRFSIKRGAVYDHQTGLTWSNSSPCGNDPVDWEGGFDVVEAMNRVAECGYSDWRVPSIVELESLVDLGEHSPALTANHHFEDVKEFYWSSTTSIYEDRYAWVLYMQDGALGVGFKALKEFFVLAVRGKRTHTGFS